MILLTTVNDSLLLATENAQSVDWTVAYVDITTTTFVPGSGQGNVAAETDTTIVAAPAAATQRQIKLITVRNAGDSTQTVTIEKDVSGTARAMTPDIDLEAGEILQYLDGQGFSVLDASGQKKIVTPSDGSAATLDDILDTLKEILELIFEINEKTPEQED